MTSTKNDDELVPIEQIMAPRPLPTANTDKARELKVLCCEDVDIPPLLPGILKDYTKGAITTQPRDLLHWSAAYFRSMCKGEIPPVKDILEPAGKEGPNGLTKGLLRVLHKQLGGHAQGDAATLKAKWGDICLNSEDMNKLMRDNNLPEVGFRWLDFIAAAASSLQPNGIREVMDIICFVMAHDVGHGTTPRMSIGPFIDTYSYVAPKFGVDKESANAVVNFLMTRATTQENQIGPKDFNDPQCPPLEGTR